MKLSINSYLSFDDPAIAPILKLDENLSVLELFHGPTLAFKDFALQFLGNLYEYQIKTSWKNIAVLGATSGDTGAAAIHKLTREIGCDFIYIISKWSDISFAGATNDLHRSV